MQNGGSPVDCKYENNDVYNNVNYFTSKYALLVSSTGTEQYNFHDNVYIVENDKFIGGIKANPGAGTGPTRDTSYSERSIAAACSTGFEKGAKFYYTEPQPFGNMYDLYEPFADASEFTDVADNFWGREAVNYVARRGLFKGVTATEFAPDGKMTRAMLVTVLSRLAGGTESINDITYTDVNKAAWYAPGVAWAEANGIVKAGGKFRPDENATREELADMLYKFALAQFKKVDLSTAKSFTDSATVTAEYADGVNFCTANGIIGGYSDGSIKPKANATRAEVATMIKRLVSALSKLEYDEEAAIVAAVASAKTYALSGDELANALNKNGIRSTVEENGTVKIITWLKEGNPVFSVSDTFAKNMSFADYGCAVVTFDAKLGSDNITAQIRRITDLTVAYDSSEIIGETITVPSNSGKILFDYSNYALTLDKVTYQNNLFFKIYPWGTEEPCMADGDYMNIESIVFFDNVVAARAYMNK